MKEFILSNWERLKYKTPLRLNGFEILYSEGKSYNPDSHIQFQLNNESFSDNYKIFKERLLNSIGNSFLPIYRMADGEFNFIENIETEKLNIIAVIKKIKNNFKRLIANQMMYERIMHKSWKEQLASLFDPYYFVVAHNESYTFSEQKLIKTQYIQDLKYISKYGILAIHFVDYAGEEHHSYFKKYRLIANWLNQYDIILNELNYSSFYYIYALLTGPDRELLLKDKKILIITSYDTNKKFNITKHLLNNENAKLVDFYKISSAKSMLEKLDLSNYHNSYDLVLVGAGIGSSNIIIQCRELNTVCIDAGIVLERYANNNLSRSRFFIL